MGTASVCRYGVFIPLLSRWIRYLWMVDGDTYAEDARGAHSA